MTGGQTLLLAVIAGSVAAMALLQMVALFLALKYTKELSRTVSDLRRDVKPLIARAQKISEDAARVTSLAAAQVERLDRIMTTTAVRIDETMNIVQGAIIEPVRQGAAVVTAVRAAIAVLRGFRQRDRRVRDEEEALFVG